LWLTIDHEEAVKVQQTTVVQKSMLTAFSIQKHLRFFIFFWEWWLLMSLALWHQRRCHYTGCIPFQK
jgi:hypothetical protein